MKNRLKEYRQNKNMKQQELSDLVGISRFYLSDIETGKANPSLSIVRNLAKALNASIDDIFFDNSVRQDAQENTHKETH